MLSETHAFSCKMVDMRRWDFFLSITAQVAISQVIGQDENDIGFFPTGFFLPASAEKRKGNNEDAQRCQNFNPHNDPQF